MVISTSSRIPVAKEPSAERKFVRITVVAITHGTLVSTLSVAYAALPGFPLWTLRLII
jgi:hypothetical protein